MYHKFKLVIWAYIFFVVLWILAKIFRATVEPFLDSTAGANLGVGFYISWLASLGQDILFFGLIGFLGLIISTKLPQDEDYNIRIDAIANGRKVGDKAREFLRERIKKLLVYNDISDVKIIIKSINIELGLAEIYAEYSSLITNMCKDVVYPLYTDYFVMPTHSINDDYGYISYLGVSEEGKPNNKHVLIEGDIYPLAKEGFSKKRIPFKVPPDGAVNYKFCYSVWHPINADIEDELNWYYILTSGFSENFSISLINRTEFDLIYNTRYIDRGSVKKEVKLINGRSLKGVDPQKVKLLELGKEASEEVVSNLAVFNDKFELYLYYNESKNSQ